MPDVTVEATVGGNSLETRGFSGPFWTSPQVGYITGYSTTNITVYKTINAGVSWTRTDVAGSPSLVTYTVLGGDWVFDGTTLHHAFLQRGTYPDHVVHYTSFSTATDTWRSSVVTVSTPGDYVWNPGHEDNFVGIGLTDSGYIHVVSLDQFGNPGSWRSVDSGASWIAKSNRLIEGFDALGADDGDRDDRLWIFPDLTAGADPDDLICFFFDEEKGNGGNPIAYRRLYDASANTVSSTAMTLDGDLVISAYHTQTAAMGQGVAQRESDGALFVCLWTDHETATADLLCFKVTTTSITQLTNVITNADDCCGAAIAFNQQNGDIYVGYIGKADGSQIFETDVQTYYKLSNDGGLTWSTEQTYGDENNDHRRIVCGPSIGNAGGRFMPAWYQSHSDIGVDIRYFVNVVNSVEIPPGGEEPPPGEEAPGISHGGWRYVMPPMLKRQTAMYRHIEPPIGRKPLR